MSSSISNIAQQQKNDKQVAYWLIAGVIMVIIQIALGGITRLTGSGLSITEWDVITGSLPPLSNGKWVEEFAKYQQTPQFKLLNADFNLSDFKSIFFWEWFHRFWARLLGVVFAIGFVYFAIKGKFRKEMIKPFIVLFVLGALQGAIGWVMVASGLVGDAVYVKPTRLAIHFVMALVLLAYVFWFALKLLVPPVQQSENQSARKWIYIIATVLLVQLAYGALMAGHKGATAASTWPDINGYLLNPPGLYVSDHGSLNFIDNKIMVHFMHRGIAYLLIILTVVLTFKLKATANKSLKLKKAEKWPLIFILLQVLLGILTVLNSKSIIPNTWGIFENLAQLHQLIGMVFMLVLIYVFYLVKPDEINR